MCTHQLQGRGFTGSLKLILVASLGACAEHQTSGISLSNIVAACEMSQAACAISRTGWKRVRALPASVGGREQQALDTAARG